VFGGHWIPTPSRCAFTTPGLMARQYDNQLTIMPEAGDPGPRVQPSRGHIRLSLIDYSMSGVNEGYWRNGQA